jgi:predicted dehydrogenase
MIKVAIVGCGKIADDHVALIRAVPHTTIVAVCDREPLMASQLCDRFDIPAHFTDIPSMLDRVHPDVVHVTTPPQSHFPVAKMCLLAGTHVFVEKPFTVDADEARELIALAERLNLRITVHHDQQFTKPAVEMRGLIDRGYLGGPPIHVESYYGYDLGQASYAKALLGDKSHWVRHLPGQLLQNVISHGVAKIAEFLPTETPTVIAHGFSSRLLKRIGEDDIIDELRVIISDNDGFTSYFTFSSQFRPCLHLVRVYGSRNAIELDHDHQTLIAIDGASYQSLLDKTVPAAIQAGRYARSFVRNLSRVVHRDLQPRGGSSYLVHCFYKSIEQNTPPPISHREMLLTVKIMDDIFAQLNRHRRAPMFASRD